MGNSGQLSPVHRKRQCLMTSKSSRSISKSSRATETVSTAPSPPIKVVHIFNPTVIKTDAANFRTLVQELTGRNYKPRGHRLRPESRTKAFNHQQDEQEAPLSLLLPGHGAHTLQEKHHAGFCSFTDSVLNVSLSANSLTEFSEHDQSVYTQYRVNRDEEGACEPCPIFELDCVNRAQKIPFEALQVCNWSDKGGVFCELGDMDLSCEQGFFSAMSRFPSLFGAIESSSM